MLRVTAPVKLPIGVIVIVELPVAPVLKSAGDEAEIVKSTVAKVKTGAAWCEAVPGVPVPVIVTVKLPAVDEVQDNDDVLVPFAVRDTGVTVNALQVKPAGIGVSMRATEPTKF